MQSVHSRKLLLPLVPAYRLALLLRELSLRTGIEPVNRLRFPVVSVGNLSAGGAGKTPLTIALAKALDARGLHVDVLSRGYGRRDQRPVRVDPEGTAEDFGDEPLLIARQTGVPVYVSGQRFSAGQLAEAEQPLENKAPGPVANNGSGLVGQGFSPDTKPAQSMGSLQAAEMPVRAVGQGFIPGIRSAESTGALAPEVQIHILDDGFQHRQLHRDVDILLLDHRDWLAEGLLPAGNLREPRKAALRATVIAIPAPDHAPELEAALRNWGWQGPVWRLHRKMEIPALLAHQAGPVAAFCGIARPEQFFAGLESAGLHIAVRIAFPDHHRFTPADVTRLIAAAKQAGATALIATEKDLVRFGKLSAAIPESLPLTAAHLRIEIDHENEAIDWLIDLLESAHPHPPL
jgi:tetraacyldisaccharide 4'-kinase